jgi:ABC-type thiamine transport system ATPase subunit
VAGFLVPDTGRILRGDTVLSSPGYALWPHMTVSQNVAFGLEVRHVGRAAARARVVKILEQVRLSGLEARYPAELSGGQQQRVALARSLVVEPAILLLDEPLSNLDARLREEMRWELKALQRETSITFVYVTHDQAAARALSDRIAVLHRGTVVQCRLPARGLLPSSKPAGGRLHGADQPAPGPGAPGGGPRQRGHGGRPAPRAGDPAGRCRRGPDRPGRGPAGGPARRPRPGGSGRRRHRGLAVGPAATENWTKGCPRDLVVPV